ncbi:MAG TPA: Crp/Fnr family transcriptional regulator [Anaerolineales bacterium]|nr:Crp/Fnr family transcriptional regulator [Anaerolineales bacterium]
MLSIIDRIIFLKEVPFFQGMDMDHLKALASLCEERLFEKGAYIFTDGDPGGILYVVVNGRVGIEQEKRAGSFVRISESEAYSYFGETDFFDNQPRTTAAVAIRDTLVLMLRREPVIEFAREDPNLAMELINILSERLRENNDRLAEMTRAQPRQLDKFFTKFD